MSEIQITKNPNEFPQELQELQEWQELQPQFLVRPNCWAKKRSFALSQQLVSDLRLNDEQELHPHELLHVENRLFSARESEEEKHPQELQLLQPQELQPQE